MQHPFSTLAPEYATLLAAMRLDPAREHELAARAAAVVALAQRHRDDWAEVASKTGVPRLWGLASRRPRSRHRLPIYRRCSTPR
jgi:hypothetical protein